MSAKRKYLSQTDVPGSSLEEASRIPKAIFDNYAGDPTTPLKVASAVDMQPSSSHFRQLCGASIAYGLTNGGYNAETIEVTDLSKKIFKPLSEGEDHSAKVNAFLKPRVINEFMAKYDGSPLPKDSIAYNVLEEMGVPDNKTEEVLALILSTADELGLTMEIKGKKYISIDYNNEPEESSETSGELVDENDESDHTLSKDLNLKNDLNIGNDTDTVDKANSEERLKRVFITHGKNKDFLEPIKKLLSFGELEAVVSVEKQSVSRPVPEKVMSDMRSCGAAIIHVSDEQKLIDSDAKEHIVMNPNVLIEIGAAMALYGKRFILLVKEGVSLPSNLQGLFEVRYSNDTLDGVTTIKLLEAINELKKIKPGI